MSNISTGSLDGLPGWCTYFHCFTFSRGASSPGGSPFRIWQSGWGLRFRDLWAGIWWRVGWKICRLAAHLVTALGLLALTYWVALDQRNGQDQAGKHTPLPAGEMIARYRGLAVGLFAVLMLQITYGAFVAGLKAGHVSNTWPLMFGRVFPPNMFGVVDPWWLNLFAAPATVHFIHRWFAFVVLGLSGWLCYRAWKAVAPRAILNSTLTIFWITVVQITLGVLVVWFNVAISLAIIHQGSAIVLFLAIVYLNYKVFTTPATLEQEERIAQPSLAR